MPQPRPDAVQEFRLLTSNYEAEFGRNTGSIVNVVTRSGTNEYHGNVRFFWRPTFLSAARYFDKANATEEQRAGKAKGQPHGQQLHSAGQYMRHHLPPKRAQRDTNAELPCVTRDLKGQQAVETNDGKQ